MISVRRERLARNHLLFREVNERLFELLDESVGTAEFLCECSNPECTATLSLWTLEYERIRSRSNQFAIVPGHEVAEIEQVMWASDRYFLVGKLYGAKYAGQTDPRLRRAG